MVGQAGRQSAYVKHQKVLVPLEVEPVVVLLWDVVVNVIVEEEIEVELEADVVVRVDVILVVVAEMLVSEMEVLEPVVNEMVLDSLLLVLVNVVQNPQSLSHLPALSPGLFGAKTVAHASGPQLPPHADVQNASPPMLTEKQ